MRDLCKWLFAPCAPDGPRVVSVVRSVVSALEAGALLDDLMLSEADKKRHLATPASRLARKFCSNGPREKVLVLRSTPT